MFHRSEDEERRAAAVEAKRPASLGSAEDREQQRRRDAVSDRRQVERVDVRERGAADCCASSDAALIRGRPT